MAADESCAYEPTGTAPLVEARKVSYGGSAHERAMSWTPDAEARLSRVPGFVRSVVAERVENFARERGWDCVTVEVMDEVRRSMPVDFSKRMPFFMRDGGKA
jgi:hypothetical protein